jgi:ESCRT-I complex subunit VPS37
MNLHLSHGVGHGGVPGGPPLPRSTSVGGSSVALSRRKQINTLMIFNENVTEVQPDVEYSVDFSVAADDGARRQIAIKVFLSQGFPESARPTLRVHPPGQAHPWLDPATGNVVGAPGMINYTVHSDLGRVVQAVKRELEKNPPRAVTNGNESQLPYPVQPQTAMPGYPNHFHTHTMPPHVNRLHQQPQSRQQQQQPQQQQQQPPPVSAIPGLTEMSIDELKELLESDVAAKEFCSKLENPTMDEVTRTRFAMREGVDATLTQNSKASVEAERLRGELAGKAAEFETLKRETADLCSRVRVHNTGSASFRNICARVSDGASEREEESDNLAEEFLSSSSGMAADEFGKRYLESRSKHHSLKVKSDKLRAGHTAGFAPF